MCWWKSATAAWPTTSSSIGHNFEAVLGDLETRMREAAADLNFEEAARLRDEVKRLRATELAVVDDPTAKQRVVQGKAGAYAGAKKYGESANLPASAMKKRGGGSSPSPLRGGSTAKGGRGGGTKEDFLLPPPLRGPRRAKLALEVGVGGPRVAALELLKSPQTPSRRNARPGIPALPPRPQTLARRLQSQHRQQNLPAHRLPPVRPRIRPLAALQRRRAGAYRGGWKKR